MSLKIKWMGWANFVVESGKEVIAFDPFFESDKKADVIFISHGHPDHCDKQAIESLKNENTVFVTNNSVAKQMNFGDVSVLNTGDKKKIRNLNVEAVYAYNLNIPNHQKGVDTGFIVEFGGKRIYHTGDSDLTDEMKNVKNIDVLFLPVGGTFTMGTDMGLEAIKSIKPKIVIPMHYGEIDVVFGGEKMHLKLDADVGAFKKKVESETATKVFVVKPGQEIEIN
ncbi:MAG: MBL fold metallo-hydrolase [Candidatus Nanoarchaeia archaeon]|nr:MBL fold metallo-hydrolase [Candidatus Nanoarchaeia archaeon]